MITVIVFAIERFFVLRKAAGTGNLENFVIKVRNLLTKIKLMKQLKSVMLKKGSVGNVVKEGLTTTRL